MRPLFIAALLLCLIPHMGYSQAIADGVGTIANLPSRFLQRMQDKTSSLNNDLTKQTEKYLQKMQRREERLQRKLYKLDSASARKLFANSQQEYAALAKRIASDTGNAHLAYSGVYQPYADSLQGVLRFLQARQVQVGGQAGLSGGQVGLPAAGQAGQTGVSGIQQLGTTQAGQQLGQLSADPRIQSTLSQLQALQAKMKDADQVKAYVQQRKQQIGDYIQQHVQLSSIMGKEYQGMNQDLYYYSQEVKQYREMLNDPDKLEQEALTVLNKLPAFQAFMQQHSQLAGLFSMPGGAGSAAQALAGLQTRSQIGSMVQSQLSSGGANGLSTFQSNVQSAQSQLDGYKQKLNQMGAGNSEADVPNFRPNQQKTKTFWKRLEYGVNFQTTHGNYYFPTETDLGGSVGYKLNDRSTLGFGASFKMGWGKDIQHISITGQGAGLRSFLDVKIKGSFSATGGFEYNYNTPFAAYQDLRQWNNWTKSGLVGVTKTVSMKNRFFKKTNVQLLWDFLSYQQVPKTQPILFRVGYNF